MTGYLTLSRRHGQGITLTDPAGATIQIQIAMEQSACRVRVSIAAPDNWRILRSELLGTDINEIETGGES